MMNTNATNGTNAINAINAIEKQRQAQEQALTASVEAAGSIITKSYLGELEQYEIVRPSEEDIDIDAAACGQFYRITKLVYNKDEHFLDKLTTIVNVANAVEGSIISIIKSDGQNVEYFMGILSKNSRGSNEVSRRKREAAATAFRGAIQGNLIGSEIATLSETDVTALQRTIFAESERSVASVSGIVALRDGERKGIDAYVQGIENLVDALRGQRYAIVLVADPIGSGQLQTIRQGYELLHTQLASYRRSSLTLSENDSITLSQAQTDGFTTGITRGIAYTQSKNKSTTKSMSVNTGVSVTAGIPFVASASVNVGISAGTASTTGDSVGKTSTESEVDHRNRSTSLSTGTGRNEGRSLQLNYENKSVQALLERIDKQLMRLDVCESFGAYDCAAYVIAEDRSAAMTVSSNYNALMRGEDSSVQGSYINSWHKRSDVSTLLDYLRSFVHPRFSAKAAAEQQPLMVTPASIVGGHELAIQIGLPKKSVAGVAVVPMAPFGRNVRCAGGAGALELGRLYHMGKPDASPVTLDVRSLAAHTFVTGSTGSGKSNTVYRLLSQLEVQGVSFLVVEPAKGEYKHVFGNRPDVSVYGTNAAVTPLLRLNPFVFPAGIHVLEHIDRLIEIMNVCWPMYAAMPAVLKDAVEDAYAVSGWDLDGSTCLHSPPVYPTFVDVMASLQRVIAKSAYSDEVKSNYTGSLLTRVKSLTNGLNGQILCQGEVDNERLFDRHAIVDLSRIGSAETKSLIMGILVMRLQERRMTQGGMNRPLRHVTVLEEAHHLLKRTSSEQSAEGANLQGKSVEMLANAIAEMRTYGEGFIIADQAPGLLDPSVIRNTNTKILLQTPDLNDRLLVGRAANLNDEQILELAKLPTGVAAVYQNNWLEPVLCRMAAYESDGKPYVYEPGGDSDGSGSGKRWKQEMLQLLLCRRLNEQADVDVERLEAGLQGAALTAKSRVALHELLEEYRRTGDLAIWQEKKHFARLAALVTELVGGAAMLEQLPVPQPEPGDLTEQLSRSVRRALGDLTEPLMLTICHCLLKDKAAEGGEWRKLFYSWEDVTHQRLWG